MLLAGVLDLFPTVASRDGRYLVADIGALTGYVNMAALGDTLTANQVWLLSSTEGGKREDLLESVRILGGPATVVYDRGRRLEETRVDPLVNAGWRSLLFLSFAAVLILSCIGFLVHAYVSYRNRLVQFALMRTVGVSVSQLITMVWVEQAMVVAVGMALGTWMGARLGAVIMPFLGHDDWGDRVVPPFTTEVDWAALLATYGLMFAVFAVITLGLVWLIRRISVHSVLRLGDS
jgi:ABC-type antimicrobial peptide transport system permease subunit